MPAHERIRTPLRCGLLVVACALVASGCSRRHYRESTDREVECLVAERNNPAWMLPDRNVEADHRSRMADFADPDCGPLPPDDMAAAHHMRNPYRFRGSKVWQCRGELEDVEFKHWETHLPRNREGVVNLNRETAIQLALLHSRDYQAAVENVYLSALDLSLARFAFDTQWAAGSGVTSEIINGGDPPNGTRLIRNNNDFGFTRRFASGGQLLVDLANTMVWESAGGTTSVGSDLSIRFLQPVLRRAFREIQLEPLTQAERSLLYELREFARFRRQFYVNIVGSGGYLGLLGLAQGIKNQEANLDSLRRNLDEHEALASAGLVAPIQVDQVFQDYEQGRLDLLRANQSLAQALDSFKIDMGLPPTLEVQLEEAVLDQFELNAPHLQELTDRNEELRLELLQNDADNPPSRAELRSIADRIDEIFTALQPVLTDLRDELKTWQEQLDDDSTRRAEQQDAEYDRRSRLAERLIGIFDEIETLLEQDHGVLERSRRRIDAEMVVAAWDDLKLICGDLLRERLADLFVIQTQVRVYLINIRPLEITQQTALYLAENYRLDLMNAKAEVVDAYRRVEIAADQLESDLDLNLEADLGTDPNFDNPFRFDSSASTFRTGLRFDGPLNRREQRNTYRATQIAYQRARRAYMAFKDSVFQDIRNDIRDLEFRQFQFEISRQQLITAARQVEEAQISLRSSQEPNSSLTRDLLNALQTLLNRKNSLIGSWVQYETSRMQLFRDLGLLHMDEFGNWINDNQSFDPADDDGPLADDDNAVIPPAPEDFGPAFEIDA